MMGVTVTSGRGPAPTQVQEGVRGSGRIASEIWEGRRTIVGGELCPFAVAYEDGRRVGLRAGDGLRVAGLAYDVDCLTHAHRHLEGLEVFVKGHQHARIDRAHQCVEQIV
jgi:hypothetical protein